MNGLEGKVALVTGAAKGIGAAIADLLVQRGVKVHGLDLEEAATTTATRGDVADAALCEQAVADAVRAHGRLDILVNSAGIQRYGTVVDTEEAEWDRVMNVNCKAMYLTAKHAVPHLAESGAGAVVNIASVQAFAAQRGVAAYSASKGAVVALTRAMAVDHAPAVRANCICPGSVDTPMLRWAAEKFGGPDTDATVAEWGAMHPMGRVSAPAEVAQAAVFLASPDASFITGAALLVDGGLLSVIGGT